MVRIATYIEAHQLHDNTQLLQQEAVRNATVRTVANAVSIPAARWRATSAQTPSSRRATRHDGAHGRPLPPGIASIIAPTPSASTANQLGLIRRCARAHGRERRHGTSFHQHCRRSGAERAVKTGDGRSSLPRAFRPAFPARPTFIKAHIVGNVLLRGEGVGSGCASGNVCTVNTLSDLESDFKDGNVIVTKMTSSEMLPYMRRASAVVVESTNPECHAAVACQAMGIPLMMDRSYQGRCTCSRAA